MPYKGNVGGQEIIKIEDEEKRSQNADEYNLKNIDNPFIRRKMANLSFELDFELNYGSTEFMFYDVEYFDDNFVPRNTDFFAPTYFPIQFTLINYFGRICINEWIYYPDKYHSVELYNCYLKALTSRGVPILATCPPLNIEEKIKMYMVKASNMIGYGCAQDVQRMYDVLKIRLTDFYLLDISLCNIFHNVNGYPKSLRNNVRKFLFGSIHEPRIRHD